MDKKRTTKDLLKAAGAMAATAMCPCIIAFGLGMAANPAAGGTAADAAGAAEAAVEQYEIEELADPMAAGVGIVPRTAEEGLVPEEGDDAETMNAREHAELMAKAKHLSDYGKDEEPNPDYRQLGYVYTEEMYYKLTGATELPDDWTDQMGPLMRGIIKEEDSFVETTQTDDGTAQEQWSPDGAIDTSAYQTGSFLAEAAGTGGPAAVQAAQRRIGYPYSQARRDSGIAFDCSSLVYWSYMDTGVNIDPGGPHTAASIAQYLESNGKAVSGGDLMPGDLIFYSYKKNGRYKNISHVAMVAGDGMMVHASSSKKMVVQQGLSLNKVVAICRPLAGVAPAEAETDPETELGDMDAEDGLGQGLDGPGAQETESAPEAEGAQDAAETEGSAEEPAAGSPVVTMHVGSAQAVPLPRAEVCRMRA